MRRVKFFLSFTSAGPSNIWETSSALLQWFLNLPVYPFLTSLKMLCPALNETGSHLHSYLSKVKVIECALKIEGKSAIGAKSSIHCSNEDFAYYWDCLKQFHKCVCESDFYHQYCSFYYGVVKHPCCFSQGQHRCFATWTYSSLKDRDPCDNTKRIERKYIILGLI